MEQPLDRREVNAQPLEEYLPLRGVPVELPWINPPQAQPQNERACPEETRPEVGSTSCSRTGTLLRAAFEIPGCPGLCCSRVYFLPHREPAEMLS